MNNNTLCFKVWYIMSKLTFSTQKVFYIGIFYVRYLILNFNILIKINRNILWMDIKIA